jgi:hypothetical protein
LFGDNIDVLTNAVIYLKERGSYGWRQKQVHQARSAWAH